MSKRLKKEIELFAQKNKGKNPLETTVDCYAYKLYHNQKSNRVAFGGMYDWSENLINKSATGLYMLSTKKFIKIKNMPKHIREYTFDEMEIILPLLMAVMEENLMYSNHKDYKDMYRPIQKKLLKKMYSNLKKVSSDMIKYQAIVYESR